MRNDESISSQIDSVLVVLIVWPVANDNDRLYQV